MDLDTDRRIGRHECCITRPDSNPAVVIDNLCTETFADEAKWDQGASVQNLARNIEGHGLARDVGDGGADGELNGCGTLRPGDRLGGGIPVYVRAQGFKDGPQWNQGATLLDSQRHVEGKRLAVDGDRGLGYGR